MGVNKGVVKNMGEGALQNLMGGVRGLESIHGGEWGGGGGGGGVKTEFLKPTLKSLKNTIC